MLRFYTAANQHELEAEEDAFAIERIDEGEIERDDGDGVGERCVGRVEPRDEEVLVGPVVKGVAGALARGDVDAIGEGGDDAGEGEGQDGVGSKDEGGCGPAAPLLDVEDEIEGREDEECYACAEECEGRGPDLFDERHRWAEGEADEDEDGPAYGEADGLSGLRGCCEKPFACEDA
jgi:hypothetical protein